MTDEGEPPAEPKRGIWHSRLRWFAAEFLVVVTGVLVALTIDAWWEARREHQLEQSYLRRLASDLATDSAEFERHLAIERQRGAQARLLIGALTGRTSEHAEALIQAIEQVGWASALRLSPYTFQELQSTGNLRLIRSAEIRNALSAYYYQTITNRDLLLEYARDRAWAYARNTAGVLPIDTRVEISLEQPLDTVPVEAALTKLAAVPDVQALLSEILVSTANLNWNYTGTQNLLRDALDRVRGALDDH